jgi:hypothetical protein
MQRETEADLHTYKHIQRETHTQIYIHTKFMHAYVHKDMFIYVHIMSLCVCVYVCV